MGLWKLTLKKRGNSNNVRYEKGMSVEVMTKGNSTSFSFGDTENKQAIADAFMRIYNIDVKKACLINSASMDAVKIS